MTEDLIAMAREADQGHAGSECEQFGGGVVSVSTLERFAALIEARAVARTREECAEIAEDMDFSPHGAIAAAIRALGERT